MNKSTIFTALIGVVFVFGCATTEYSGKGGMTAYSIKPEVYEYHYEHGFTGVDAMGWDPNLQYAWSRSGAAITCGIQFDKKAVINNMIKEYGESEFVHDMNGIMFHHLQSKTIKNFCNSSRVNEIKLVLAKLEKGDFPKYFREMDKNTSATSTPVIIPTQPKDSTNIHPSINGLPVIAVYYDNEETPIGYGKYHAFLFMLQENKFVIWRNKDSVDYVLSNISTLEAQYPTSKHPVIFSRDGASIHGQDVIEYPKTKYRQAYTFNSSYEGMIQGDIINLTKSSVNIYSDGTVEKSGTAITWDFHKIKEYSQ